MLALEGVRVRRGAFRLDADLSVPTGALVAVMGPSGSGKSTLLDVVAGFVEAEGIVRWAGERIDDRRPGRRPAAVLFQDGNLFPHLTARQNVGLGIDPRLRLSRADRARADAALAEAGLAGLERRHPADLSGGQRARVALARIAVQDRPLVLLDEAFGGLGPALAREMLERTAALVRREGRTLLMVTHDPDEARAACPLTIAVHDGRAHPPRPTDALLVDPPPALAAYLRRDPPGSPMRPGAGSDPHR